MGKASRRKRELRKQKKIDVRCQELVWVDYIDEKWKIYGCPPGACHAKCLGVYADRDVAHRIAKELFDEVRVLDFYEWDRTEDTYSIELIPERIRDEEMSIAFTEYARGQLLDSIAGVFGKYTPNITIH